MTWASCLEVAGYARLLTRWARLPAPAWLDEINGRAAACDLRSAAGTPIRFEFERPGEPRSSALAYERRVHDEGRVVCRREGPGFEHDRWNAAVWLAWPRTKAALNGLHARDACGKSSSAGDGDPRSVPGQRSRVRDFATLVDESGLAWLSSRPACDALLARRRWRALFVDARHDLVEGVVPIVIGHGLLGKLGRPYKRLTAQAIVVPVAAVLIESARGRAWHAGNEGGCSLPAIDEAIAGRVIEIAAVLDARDRMARSGVAVDPAIDAVADAASGPSAAKSAPANLASKVAPEYPRPGSRCLPLPVLALPGWCDGNRDPRFYDDPIVFRPLAGQSGTTPLSGSRGHEA